MATSALFWKGNLETGLGIAHAFQVRRVKVECCRDERFVRARTVTPKNFFAELKRRNVYKVAYAIAFDARYILVAK
jgi:hypothetical protein